MALSITSDPIMTRELVQSILDVTEPDQQALVINSLSRKFMNYTGRVQLVANNSTPITEKTRGIDNQTRLYLRCSPINVSLAISAKVYYGQEEQSEYTYADEELMAFGDDYVAWLEKPDGWPGTDSQYHVLVSYYAGWTDVPGDVLEGAVIQGRIDLRRQAGEAGMQNKSSGGESVSFEQGGLIKAVKDLWRPYRLMV